MQSYKSYKAIKKKQFKDKDHMQRLLKDKMPEEVFTQQQAGSLFSDTSPYKVLEVLDWYIYDNYYVIVTKYDEEFQDLHDCTLKQENEQFCEKKCRSIFKMFFDKQKWNISFRLESQQCTLQHE